MWITALAPGICTHIQYTFFVHSTQSPSDLHSPKRWIPSQIPALLATYLNWIFFCVKHCFSTWNAGAPVHEAPALPVFLQCKNGQGSHFGCNFSNSTCFQHSFFLLVIASQTLHARQGIHLARVVQICTQHPWLSTSFLECMFTLFHHSYRMHDH